MILDNKIEIGFSILPRFGKVIAEIYQIKCIGLKEPLHIHLVRKEFGSFFRGVNESDYTKAKEWVNKQIESITKSNKL